MKPLGVSLVRWATAVATGLLVSCASGGTTGVASKAGGPIAYALSGQGGPTVVFLTR